MEFWAKWKPQSWISLFLKRKMNGPTLNTIKSSWFDETFGHFLLWNIQFTLMQQIRPFENFAFNSLKKHCKCRYPPQCKAWDKVCGLRLWQNYRHSIHRQHPAIIYFPFSMSWSFTSYCRGWRKKVEGCYIWQVFSFLTDSTSNQVEKHDSYKIGFYVILGKVSFKTHFKYCKFTSGNNALILSRST